MSWLFAFAGFALLIVLHEFGHFLAAKRTGMRVERFFLFFPPRLWSVKRGETEYGIGWIPLGGFVKITGMNPDEVDPPEGQEEHVREVGLLERVESVDQDKDPDLSVPGAPLSPELRERAYYNQPVWKRIVVIGAGPAMNILIAFVILFGLAMTADQISGPGLKIRDLTTNSPAKGLLQRDDEVVSIDGASKRGLPGDDRADAFREQIGSHTCAGQQTEGCSASTPVKVVVRRNGQLVPVEVTPKYDPGAEQALMGVRFEPTEFAPVDPSPGQAAGDAVDQMWFVVSETGKVFARILEPEQRKQINGVVGAYESTREAVNLDVRLAFGVLALISLSLGVLNLLPFLPLDGGHIFWSVVEKLRGRRVPFSVMERSGAIGFVLIMFIALIGLSNDLGRIISGEGFGLR
jgi:regulator of sigma E protease